MQNDSTATDSDYICYIVDITIYYISLIASSLWQASYWEECNRLGNCLKSPRHEMNHTPKKLLITKYLKGKALILLENKQVRILKQCCLSCFTFYFQCSWSCSRHFPVCRGISWRETSACRQPRTLKPISALLTCFIPEFLTHCWFFIMFFFSVPFLH